MSRYIKYSIRSGEKKVFKVIESVALYLYDASGKYSDVYYVKGTRLRFENHAIGIFAITELSNKYPAYYCTPFDITSYHFKPVGGVAHPATNIFLQ